MARVEFSRVELFFIDSSPVYVRVQCWEPKTGQEKVQFYCEDDSIFLSPYYLSMLSTQNLYSLYSAG